MTLGIKTTMGIDYDFIKTEEAKQIFIKLEKKRMLLKDYECDSDDYDLDNIFTFEDEEKKEMVERFILRGKVISLTIADAEKHYIDWSNKRIGEVVADAMGLKNIIDPEYIYETWLAESRKLKNECLFVEFVEDKNPIDYLIGNGVLE